MLDHGLCTVTGFEPQTAALTMLELRKRPLTRYRPKVVGDDHERRLKISKAVGMTSLLIPDQNRLRCRRITGSRRSAMSTASCGRRDSCRIRFRK
jgi:hypothetical protein